MAEHHRSSDLSRRDFLAAMGAASAAAAIPSGAALAQAPAKYRRVNVSSPQGKTVLESYKKAIRAMLALPATDPRNWYRNAIVHALDCPHGNWWFVVWHRGYLGWFEQTCRDLSGDPTFAFPYWDWTAEPKVPDAMFDDVLTPTNPAYIAAFKDFKAQFGDVVNTLWNTFTPGQIDQLLVRGLRFPDDLWFDISYPPSPYFFDRPNARGLTREKPELDPPTSFAVSLPILLDALSPRDFITFASPKTLSHSGLTGFGVLEGMPHNRVHNNVGGIITDSSGKTTFGDGFMQANLSPVDPLFFLHHSNIDRLWDVWTRKQAARGYPILPQGYPTQPGAPVPPRSDYDLWSKEPFLFFVDSNRQPVTKTAGSYAAIGDFNYDYQPGSGEQVVIPPPTARAAPARAGEKFTGRIVAPRATASRPAGGTVTLPARVTGPGGPRLLAHITVALPPIGHVRDHVVVVNAPPGAAGVGPASPHFAATLSMFGHQIMRGPVTFTVPLSATVATLQKRKLLSPNAPVRIDVVPGPAATGPRAMAAHADEPRAEVLSIVVEAQ